MTGGFFFADRNKTVIRRILTIAFLTGLIFVPAFAQTGGYDPQRQTYPAQSSPQGGKTLWALKCWQDGVEIINEHALTDFTYGTNSFSATLQKDGKIYVSGLDQNSGTVCQVIEYQR